MLFVIDLIISRINNTILLGLPPICVLLLDELKNDAIRSAIPFTSPVLSLLNLFLTY